MHRSKGIPIDLTQLLARRWHGGRATIIYRLISHLVWRSPARLIMDRLACVHAVQHARHSENERHETTG